MSRSPSNPFAERLVARFAPVAARRAGACVALWGPPGIGASYAARALRTRLTCASSTVHAADGLGRWADALPRSRRLVVWAERALDRMEAGDAVPTADVAQALLAVWSRTTPFVLHVDDLHEASTDRRALVEVLARAVAGMRGAGLIVTTRTPPGAPWEAWRVEPLNEAEEAVLLQGTLGARLPEAVRAWVRGRSEGNPLVALEHLRYGRRTGALWHDGDGWRWRAPQDSALPRTLEALVERALHGLDDASSDLLSALVYLPRDASAEAVAVASGLPEDRLDAAMAVLTERGLVTERWAATPDTRHDVAHPTVRDVARRRLDAPNRRTVAARIVARWGSDPATAAPLVSVDDLDDDAALDLFRRAADAADAQGHAVVAGRWRAQAADLATGSERATLALAAGKALLGHDVDEVVRLARMAVEVAPGVETVRLLAGALAGTGRHEEANAALARLPDDERVGARWARHLVLVQGGAGNARAAVDTWRANPALHVDPEPALAYAAAFALVVVGEHEEAEAVAAAARIHARTPLDRCRLAIVLGLARAAGPAPSAAEAALDEAVEVARSHDLGGWLAAALHNRSALLETLGRDEAMLADVEEALAVYGRVGDAVKYASTQTKLARHLTEAGRFGHAEELLLAARETLQRASRTPFLVTCECALATLYDLWRPDHGRVLALEHAAAALRIARDLGVPAKVMQALAAGAACEADHGVPETAVALATELLGLVEPIDDPQALVDSLVPLGRALAAAGRRSAARAHLERAVEVAATLPRAAVLRHAALELALVRGDNEAAAQERAWLERHGLHGLAARASHGGVPSPAGTAEAPVAPAVAGAPRFGRLGSDAVATARPNTDVDAVDGPWLEVLGVMRLRRGDEVEVIRGHRRRTLLAMLLEARLLGREGADRLDLLDQISPHLDDDRAIDALKQLVYQLRRRWGAGVVRLHGDAYALGAIASDAETFLANGDTRLWRGPCLPDEGVARARALLLARLSGCVRALLDTDPGQAARLGRILVESEPYDTDALTLAVRALRADGDMPSLEAWYRERRAQLAEVGEHLPDGWSGLLTGPVRA